MGKFTGLLLVTDIDNTLLNSEGVISDKNKEAIEYFKAEGGLFTVATGRAIYNALPFFGEDTLNAPVICCNGAQICDYQTGELLWSLTLGRESIEVIEYVEKNLPSSGCEIYSGGHVYLHKSNRVVEEHISYESFSLKDAPLHEIPTPWERVIFIQSPEDTDRVCELIKVSPFHGRYKFVRAWTKYYEMLHSESSKGRALIELVSMRGISMHHTIAVGDYYNDLELIGAAGIGVAVANGVPELKQLADYVLQVDCDHHAIYDLVEQLDWGKMAIR